MVIGGYWQLLNGNNTIIAPGTDKFKVVGAGVPKAIYNWSFELSTAYILAPSVMTENIIVGNTTITSQSLPGYESVMSRLPITAIDVDPVWSIPSGITHWFNISTTQADTSNAFYQYNAINLTFDSGAEFQPYANKCFTNWVVFNGITGNILYSWLLGNTVNAIQGCGYLAFNTMNSITIFANYDHKIPAGATATNDMAIGFYPMATNSMNGNNIGENPLLSCANGATLSTCGTYGLYDNGANVFKLYDNFIGTTLNTNTWAGSGGATVNNGLTLAPNVALCTAGSKSVSWVNANSLSGINNLYSQLTQAETIDVMESVSGSSGQRARAGFFNTFEFCGLSSGSGYAYGDYSTASNIVYSKPNGAETALTSPTVNNRWNLWTMATGSGIQKLWQNYTATVGQKTLANVPTFGTTGNFVIESNYGSTSTYVQWLDARQFFYVLPTINLGNAQTFPPPTLTLSSTSIEQGQSILFTASTSQNKGPYTYNYLVIAYNSQTASNQIIANMLITSNSYTSNSWNWKPSGNLYVGNTMFEANVIVTDSIPTTTNSLYYSFGYASNSYKVPSGVTHWFNVSTTQVDASNTFYQYNAINLTFDSGAKFQPYANKCFTNWVIFNGLDGNILYSWLLGNTVNAIQGCGYLPFNTMNSITIFINYDHNIAAGATATNDIAIGFYSMDTNSMNGNNIGENPVLSCANGASTTTCGTYGLYDNGANVFKLYDNFIGATLSTNIWAGSGRATVNNGLTLGGNLYVCTAGSRSVSWINANSFSGINNPYSQLLSAETIDVMQSVASTATPRLRVGFFNTFEFCGLTNGMGYGYGDDANPSNIVFSSPNGAESALISPTAISTKWNLWTMGAGNGIQKLWQNYTATSPQITTGANVPAFGTTGNLVIESNYGDISESLQWVDARQFFYVSPTMALGPVQASSSYISPSNPILTLSNTFIDQGQSILFTAGVTNGNNLFTYNFLVVNSITPATILGNMLFTGITAQTKSWTWTPLPNLYTANTFKANVVITETGAFANTVNTIYNGIGYNGAAIIGISLTGSNTLLDSGQYATFTLTDTGGTDTGTYGFNAMLWNATTTPGAQQGGNAPISGVGGSNTITIQVHSPNSPAGGNVFNFNAIETDTGTTVPFTNNSIKISINVNSVLVAGAVTMSNTLLDSGQYDTFSSAASGGQPAYSYQWYTGTLSTCASDSAITGATLSTYTTQPVSGNYFCYAVTDHATTPITVYSATNQPTVNSMPLANTLLSNTLLDAGQWETLTFLTGQGTAPFTINGINVTGNKRVGIGNFLVTTISGKTTFSFQTIGAGSFTYAYNAVDYGTTANYPFNSPYNSMTVNSALAVSLSPSVNSISIGTAQLMTATVTPGQPPYTYNFVVTNSAGYTANMLVVGNAFTSNQFSFTPSAIGVYNVNVVVIDSASIPETVASANSIMTFVSPYTPPTTPTLNLSNTMIDQGQSILFTANTLRGAQPYSYSYNIYAYNSQDAANFLIANMLFASNSYTSNSWFWAPNSLYVGNSMFRANVAIMDAYTTTINSVSVSFGYNAVLATTSLIIENTTPDTGQTDILTVNIIGGTSPYTVNFFNVTGDITLYKDIGIIGTTDNYSLVVNTQTNENSFSYNVIVKDSAGMPLTINSITETIVANKTIYLNSTPNPHPIQYITPKYNIH